MPLPREWPASGVSRRPSLAAIRVSRSSTPWVARIDAGGSGLRLGPWW